MQNRKNSTSDIITSLEKHPKRFTDRDNNYCPHSIAAGLNKLHSSNVGLKSKAIAAFNATHTSDNLVFPTTHGKLVYDEQNGFAKNLHLGTTRIWNADGSINEERWKKFVDFVTADQKDNEEKIVTQSKLKAYLKHCYDNDPQDPTTGRNSLSLLSSKPVQGLAASAAWDEVFDRLACGWKTIDNKSCRQEPYITLSLVREFFEDSTEAFAKAENRELPAPKF